MLPPLFRWLVRVLVVLAVGARFFHVSDAPREHADGETLLRLAGQANQEGRLARTGIVSTRGRPHGPVAVWTLQLWLSVTDRLYVVRFLQCLLVTGLTVLGVAWMAHALRGLLEWEDVASILLVPIFWHYARFIWDNTLLIPFTGAGLGAYLCFCRTRRIGWLFPASFFSSLTIGTHLMGLSFPAALAGHFLLYHRDVLYRNERAVGALLAVFVLPLTPYLMELARAPVTDTGVWLTRWFAFAWEQLHRGFLAVSTGALTFGLGWSRSASPVLWIGEGLAYAFGLLGLFWGATGRRSRYPEEGGFIGELWALAWLIIAMALVVQILARLDPLLHYFNGCWTGYQLALFLAWARRISSQGLAAAKLTFFLANAWGIGRLIPA